MTTNNEEQEESEVVSVPADARISFLRRNDLTKTLKRVDKSVDKAIAFLETVMQDDKNDVKVRVQAAQFILDKKVQISESVSKDALQRAIAESRLLLAERATHQRMLKDAGAGSAEDDEESCPVYMPSVILDHSNLKEM